MKNVEFDIPIHSMYAVGIDVGGTHTRAGFVDQSGGVTESLRVPTPLQSACESFVAFLSGLIDRLRRSPAVIGREWKGVALAVPGLLDSNAQALIRSVNLPFLEHHPLAAALEESTRMPVKLVTDADAATWGEYHSWNSIRASSPRNVIDRETPARSGFIHLRLGTGVACGWVSGDRLEPMEPHRIGHLDALIVDDSPRAIRCRCGKLGCLETLLSGHALLQRAAESGYADGVEGLMQAVMADEPAAVDALDFAIDGLQRAVEKLIERYQPESISVGGGLMETIGHRVWNRFRPVPFSDRLIPARLGDEAGIIGAALLFLKTNNEVPIGRRS